MIYSTAAFHIIPGKMRSLFGKLSILCLFIVEAFCSHEREGIITGVIKQSLLVTARTCMDRVNATEDDLEYLRNDPPFPEKGACVMKCLLEKIGIVRSNRYSKGGFMAVITPLVLRNKKKMEHMKSVAENCDKEINHAESGPCQLGNEITSCVFKYAPELHFNKKM